MTIKQLLQFSSPKLKQKKILSADLDTVILLYQVLKKPKSFLFTHPENQLSKIQIKKFNNLLKRRLKHEPIAYIIGHKEFLGFDFIVNKNVMIPRPETEMLVEEVIQAIGSRQLAVVDIGTGSGCIAVSLAKFLPQATIYATEISKPALKLAKVNAQKNKVSNKMKFYQGNLLAPIKNKKINILVANLPYISKKEYNSSPFKRELSYEPQIALTDNQDGLTIFRNLFAQIDSYKIIKKSLQYIFLEIGYNQTEQIEKICKTVYPRAKIIIKKDLCGFDRVCIVKI